MLVPADGASEPQPDPGPQPRRGGGPKPLILGILGLISILFGVWVMAFSCFMVTDSSCHTEAEGRALIPLVVGGALILWAIVRAVGARR